MFAGTPTFSFRAKWGFFNLFLNYGLKSKYIFYFCVKQNRNYG